MGFGVDFGNPEACKSPVSGSIIKTKISRNFLTFPFVFLSKSSQHGLTQSDLTTVPWHVSLPELPDSSPLGKNVSLNTVSRTLRRNNSQISTSEQVETNRFGELQDAIFRYLQKRQHLLHRRRRR